MPTLADLLALDAAEADRRWTAVEAWMRARFGKEEASPEGVLFLIGLQGAGRAYEPRMERDEKERLVIEASLLVFEAVGGYRRVGMDASGAWIWERTGAWPEALPPEAQERLLRLAVAFYLAPFLEP
jgi:hypothetical protein